MLPRLGPRLGPRGGRGARVGGLPALALRPLRLAGAAEVGEPRRLLLGLLRAPRLVAPASLLGLALPLPVLPGLLLLLLALLLALAFRALFLALVG